MRFRTQTAHSARPQLTWLRVVTLLCVVLLGSINTAQAAHIHGQWLPHSNAEITRHATGPAATAEDACPLCVAMHSALPMRMVVVSTVALLVRVQLPIPAVRHIASVWHFELFSRPPPTLLS